MPYDHQIYPDLPQPPDVPKPDQELEKLFLSVAGPNQEIGWMELKSLLDYNMKDGK